MPDIPMPTSAVDLTRGGDVVLSRPLMTLLGLATPRVLLIALAAVRRSKTPDTGVDFVGDWLRVLARVTGGVASALLSLSRGVLVVDCGVVLDVRSDLTGVSIAPGVVGIARPLSALVAGVLPLAVPGVVAALAASLGVKGEFALLFEARVGLKGRP